MTVREPLQLSARTNRGAEEIIEFISVISKLRVVFSSQEELEKVS
jgi:hypothetical protein